MGGVGPLLEFSTIFFFKPYLIRKTSDLKVLFPTKPGVLAGMIFSSHLNNFWVVDGGEKWLFHKPPNLKFQFCPILSHSYHFLKPFSGFESSPMTVSRTSQQNS